MNKKPKLHYCWIILIGTCIMMSVGFGMCLNSVGVFLPFVADSLGVTKGQVSYYMTIQGFGMIIGMYLAGKLIPRKNIKILLSIATILMAVCFFILSGGTHLYHWYIVAIPLGISVAFIAPLPISILISNWFEKKRGLASGIAFAFSGITGSILSPLATKMISAFGWQTTYRFYGLLALVFMLPTAIFLLVNSPEKKGLLPYGVDTSELHKAEKKKAVPVSYGTSLKDALHMPIFYTSILLAGFLSIAGGFSQQFPNHAVTMGMGAEFGSYLVSICMMMQLVANVPLGILCDKIGVRLSATLYSAVGGAGALLLATAGTAPLMYLGCAMYGIGICQTMVISPQVAREIFGKKDYGQINSIVMMCFALFGAFSHTVYASIADARGSYALSLALASIFYLVSIFLVNFSCLGGKSLMEENRRMEGKIVIKQQFSEENIAE